MKVIIQLQYSLTDSRVFNDVKNITQSSLHPTQPNPTHDQLWCQVADNCHCYRCCSLEKKKSIAAVHCRLIGLYICNLHCSDGKVWRRVLVLRLKVYYL